MLTMNVELPGVLQHPPVHLRVGGPALQGLSRVLSPRGVAQGRGGALARVGSGLKEEEREKISNFEI